MQAPKGYVVSVLVTICTLLAAGYPQTSDARPGLEVTNSQDASQKPSNSGSAAPRGTIPGATSTSAPTGSGQKIGAMSPGQRATPACTPADQNSSVAASAPSSPSSPTTIPQGALFELFFNNISALNQVADSDDKAGNHTWAAQWRTHDARGAGLNDAEGQILQEVTLDCLRLLKEQDAKFRAAAEKYRAQLVPCAPIHLPEELVQMDEVRKKIVSDHIERLREALGDTSFSKLDNYIHSSFHVPATPPNPAPSSTTVVEKSQKESQ